MIFPFFSTVGVASRLAKFVPHLLIIAAFIAMGYFGWNYLDNMKATVVATKDEIIQLKSQNDEIRQANIAIAEDMKGVKTLTENFNQKVITIRTNTHTITNTVSSPEFTTLVQVDPIKAQLELNDTFNSYFNEINSVTK